MTASEPQPHIEQDPAADHQTASVPSKWRERVAWALLFLLPVLVYAQALRFDFIAYDDDQTVYAHPVVLQGLTLPGIRWAFTHAHNYIYMPLTSLSHMLDVSLFGTWAGGHHLANLLIHAVTAVLLYIALARMTARPALSLFAAALFAIGPMRADPVLWISSRKDLLSGMFFMLALISYAHYARKPTLRAYACSLCLFAAALLAKPALLMTPVLLLLLDVWPLARFSRPLGKQTGRLILEKIPFCVIAAAAAILAWYLQDATEETAQIPLTARLVDAVVYYARYALHLLPMDVSIHYPPVQWAAWQVIISAAFLLIVTAAAIILRRPYFTVGWLWYIITLLPVIGLVRHSHTSFAGRYAYLPHIGLCILLAWGGHDLLQRALGPHAVRRVTPVLAVAVIAVLAASSGWYAGYWRNTETVFSRALELTENNDIAHRLLGQVLLERGDNEAALAQFRQAIEASPRNSDGYYKLGHTLLRLRQYPQAAEQLAVVVRFEPTHAWAQADYAIALSHLGQTAEAVTAFEQAVRLNADAPDVRYEFGRALLAASRPDEACRQFSLALAQAPGNGPFCTTLGMALLDAGLAAQATPYFARAAELLPDATTLFNLGSAWIAQGKWQDALDPLERAAQLRPADYKTLGNLALAQLRLGKTNEALANFQQALQVQPGNPNLLLGYAETLLRTGKADDARNTINQVLAKDPQNPAAHQLLQDPLLNTH